MLLEGVEGVVLLALAVVTWPLTRFLLTNLGAHREERQREWPGDRLLERVDVRTTRAISIAAPTSTVWPWLVQIGLGRGGFHSYELLERIGGIDVRNVEAIGPRWQALAVGDEITLHPSAPAVQVALVTPNESLCFRDWKTEEDLAARDPAIVRSWSLYLEPQADKGCRFLVRACTHRRRPPTLGARLLGFFLEDPLDVVMEQRMLRTVRRLAEAGRTRV